MDTALPIRQSTKNRKCFYALFVYPVFIRHFALRKDASVHDDSVGDDDADFAMAFDLDADIEPVNEPAIAMNTGYGERGHCMLLFDEKQFNFFHFPKDDEELAQMSATDRIAIMKCRGLHKTINVLEDLRPVDASSASLEYSYRPLDNIGHFWAGPSYWKFRQARRPLRLTQLNSATISHVAAADAKRKKKPAKYMGPITDDYVYDPSIFISVNSKEAKKIRCIDIKKWDENKLKLPVDYHVDRTRFDRYVFAPGIPKKYNLKALDLPGDLVNAIENGDVEVKRSYFSFSFFVINLINLF